ncbi:hypothetical protein GGS23DRAFT_580742 [Durotheca rogersii]|uniref:uncharacterized protein n=1 Tax=Durotheca rogersii TaxID=419775 RepID=UPI00221F0B9A|nr:uncharacterized protein GGS23DRAFT_580742 [Durotheca rogersii]KAI5860587.1 hypothetical protein GGS23DRAFT_580742 [Durotheca rogersii]
MSSAAPLTEGAASSTFPPAMPSPVASRESKQPGQKGEESETLKPLTPAEFRGFNRLAEHMDMFHEHFRTTWNTLWAAACAGDGVTAGRSPRARALIDEGLSFVTNLEMHHSIEEKHLFPVLARRMPDFQDAEDGGGAGELLRQHREIDEGMERFQQYLRACRDGEQELDMTTLKAHMETWGTVLWTHLDEEVQMLGAENMRKYWTLEEVKQIGM